MRLHWCTCALYLVLCLLITFMSYLQAHYLCDNKINIIRALTCCSAALFNNYLTVNILKCFIYYFSCNKHKKMQYILVDKIKNNSYNENKKWISVRIYRNNINISINGFYWCQDSTDDFANVTCRIKKKRRRLGGELDVTTSIQFWRLQK